MWLHDGYHPKCFKSAIFCVFLKPGKRLCSEPKLYHLIAFFSYLGKVLERVVARQFSTFALKAKLFGELHFGAIPSRYAVNAVATLTYDVKIPVQQ